ncbi:MAG: hypothetical protein R3B13_12495 [Polyangiaceae bacterium]
MMIGTPLERWLGHFTQPALIYEGAAVRMHAAWHANLGSPRLVVSASPDASNPLLARRLDEVARVHGLLDHPRLPVVAERGRRDGVEFLAFECPAIIDGSEVLRRIAAKGMRLSFGAADAFISGLREALQTGHDLDDPVRGGPICAGTLCYANILFDSSGNYWLLALGDNLLTSLDTGAPAGELTFHAPEVGAGGRPSPSGDYVALRHLMRSLLPYVEFPERLARVVQGNITPEDAELVGTVLWFEQRVMAAPPAERPPVADAVAMSERLRQLLGTRLEPESFAGAVRQTLGAVATPPPEAEHWSICELGRWIRQPDGERIDLSSHLAIGRIALALARAHANGAVLEIPQLVAAGWPGEKVSERAGANRVYVAISTLRRMGLRGILQKQGRGYCFAPSIKLSVVTPPS